MNEGLITAEPSSTAEKTLVFFKTGELTCALPVEPIIQIISMVAITPLPQTDKALLGVIDFHGQSAPVIDLACHLEMPQTSIKLYTPILLANICGQVTGLVVSEVMNILTCPLEKIESANRLLPEKKEAAPVISGLVHTPDGLVPILDLDHLLTPEQAKLLAEILKQLNGQPQNDKPSKKAKRNS